ncbi:MAG: LacI family transcriptional regulator [Actinomyces ruminicola]|uniref:Transcriptional regulator, LacI family n=1 Tax=Actinomyces ruminicola TaxID=332524 RepID=A0A1H0A3F7_9ACTO|nr:MULTISPECIES: LacI family DNA-binding transcriptional regulator [Actinomyces]MBE6481948.1 LacI family transcriptional regulator [Actinomyces ruminicola]SDN27256.1 transcriptional regulator, LacI family [Actinomyces ruminicola]
MATMQDVARKANVAVSTVSYALSGARPVAPETARRIRAAMEELNYQPNAMARGLASRRSHTLAMTFPSFDTAMGETVFEIVRGAQHEASRNGYNLAVWPLEDAEAGAELVNLVRQGKADGVLLVEVGVEDPRAAALKRARLPFVMVGRTADPTGLAYVDIDFERTVDDAVGELYRLGHRRIAFIGRPASQTEAGYGPAVRGRQGYLHAVGNRALAPLAYDCDANPQAGQAIARELAALEEPPTGIVVMNDMAALGLLAGLHAMGLRVPQDVSVVGAVSSPTLGAMTVPALTTTHAPGERMGAFATRALLAILDERLDPADCHQLVTCAVVRGESLGPVPERGEAAVGNSSEKTSG